jgi:hypothetical protein
MKTYDSHSALRAHYKNFHKIEGRRACRASATKVVTYVVVVWARSQVTQERSRIRVGRRKEREELTAQLGATNSQDENPSILVALGGVTIPEGRVISFTEKPSSPSIHS